MTFPLMILSGMLLPLDTAPTWMRSIALVNPLTYIVEAERALFAGNYAHASVPFGALAAIIVAVLGLGIGSYTINHSTE